jgi:hypothetical protein
MLGQWRFLLPQELGSPQNLKLNFVAFVKSLPFRLKVGFEKEKSLLFRNLRKTIEIN